MNRKLLAGAGVLSMALTAAAIAWASYFELDIVIRGDGRIVPSRLSQVVQSLEGGILSELLVTEGALVEQGQIVARIQDIGFAAQLAEQTVQRDALRLRVARLAAEARGDAVFDPPEGEDHGGSSLDEERALFAARAAELAQALEVIIRQADLHRAELVELSAKQEALRKGVELATEEWTILDRLSEQNAVPRIEVVRARRALETLEGELGVTAASIERTRVAVAEAEARYRERQLGHRRTAQQELAEAATELAALTESIRAAADRVQRTAIRAPARGIVNRVEVTTEGAVLKPGQTLMEVTPVEDDLLVEVRVRPSDIGLLRAGLPAVIRVTAFDFAKYGSLDGVVTRVGSDTVTDERGDVFYRVMVTTASDNLGDDGAGHAVMPGMQAIADIIVGQRRIIDYVARPLAQVRAEAFREP